jgi:hypothetical protein
LDDVKYYVQARPSSLASTFPRRSKEMERMIKMWIVPIKNERTGEETSVRVPGHNPYQAKNKAMEEICKNISDPFQQLSFGEPEFLCNIPQSALE